MEQFRDNGDMGKMTGDKKVRVDAAAAEKLQRLVLPAQDVAFNDFRGCCHHTAQARVDDLFCWAEVERKTC